MVVRREKELRCFCKRHPLLATYGIDKDAKLFVHIKIWKAQRIYGEIVVEGGTVKVRCRDCLRWHRVRIIDNKVSLQESSGGLPEQIHPPDNA